MSLCVPQWMEFSSPCLVLPSSLLPSMLCLGLLFCTKGQVFLVQCIFSTFMMCVCTSQLFDAVLKNNSVDIEKKIFNNMNKLFKLATKNTLKQRKRERQTEEKKEGTDSNYSITISWVRGVGAWKLRMSSVLPLENPLWIQCQVTQLWNTHSLPSYGDSMGPSKASVESALICLWFDHNFGYT